MSDIQQAQISRAIPWSVAQSIRSRVALLPRAATDMLAVAAVAGQITHYRVLHAAATTATLDDGDIVAALDAACHAQLLAESGHGFFAFTHDLIREVVAADLSRARRALLHRRVASALELMPDAEREQRAADLAWHFHEAGDPARALTYALLAGDRARGLYAYEQAERHYRDAVELARECGSARDEAEALERLGLVIRLAGRREEAFAVLVQAAELYRKVGDRDGLGRTTAFIAIGDLGSGKQQQGLTAMRATLDNFGPVDETELSARTLADIFLAQAYLSSTPGEKLQACERAARHIHPVEGLSRIAEVERVRGGALIQLGRLEEAVHAFETSSKAAQGTGDFATLQGVLNNLALIHAAKGELTHAQQHYERALEVAKDVNAPALIAVLRCNMSRLAFV